MTTPIYRATAHKNIVADLQGEYHLQTDDGHTSKQSWKDIQEALVARYENQMGEMVQLMQAEVQELGQISQALRVPAKPARVIPMADSAALLIQAVHQRGDDAHLMRLADWLSYEQYGMNARMLLEKMHAQARGVA